MQVKGDTFPALVRDVWRRYRLRGIGGVLSVSGLPQVQVAEAHRVRGPGTRGERTLTSVLSAFTR
jgi:hypothetical protein